MLVMDKTSFYYSGRVKQLCPNAGVKLLYVPPYSSDFDPIEEFFFSEGLRRLMYKEERNQGFHAFLLWCIHYVNGKQESAEGHFRRAGITI